MTTIIHKSDIGTKFRCTVKDSDGVVIDVSTAGVKYIYFRKPDYTLVKQTASFLTDGSDGIIQYVGVSGDIDQIGTWSIEGYVETSDGKFFTEKEDFEVESTLYTT